VAEMRDVSIIPIVHHKGRYGPEFAGIQRFGGAPEEMNQKMNQF
jgi:hypothetical protein